MRGPVSLAAAVVQALAVRLQEQLDALHFKVSVGRPQPPSTTGAAQAYVYATALTPNSSRRNDVLPARTPAGVAHDVVFACDLHVLVAISSAQTGLEQVAALATVSAALHATPWLSREEIAHAARDAKLPCDGLEEGRVGLQLDALGVDEAARLWSALPAGSHAPAVHVVAGPLSLVVSSGRVRPSLVRSIHVDLSSATLDAPRFGSGVARAGEGIAVEARLPSDVDLASVAVVFASLPAVELGRDGRVSVPRDAALGPTAVRLRATVREPGGDRVLESPPRELVVLPRVDLLDAAGGSIRIRIDPPLGDRRPRVYVDERAVESVEVLSGGGELRFPLDAAASKTNRIRLRLDVDGLFSAKQDPGIDIDVAGAHA